MAVEPAEVKQIGGGDVGVERPVVSAVGPKGREALGQLDLLGDLAHRVALVRQPESLVVDEAIEIALLLQQLHDLGVTPGRPVVLGEDHLRLAAPHGQRLVERSEEHTSELQSLMRISYAVFCLKTKNTT